MSTSPHEVGSRRGVGDSVATLMPVDSEDRLGVGKRCREDALLTVIDPKGRERARHHLAACCYEGTEASARAWLEVAAFGCLLGRV
jgi:hypothetical protein